MTDFDELIMRFEIAVKDVTWQHTHAADKERIALRTAIERLQAENTSLHAQIESLTTEHYVSTGIDVKHASQQAREIASQIFRKAE